MDVTLLGPQRSTAAARAAVRELMPDGPITTINAGWQEREDATEELNDVLGGRMVNLTLHARWLQVTGSDPVYAEAERRLTRLLAELQATYALRLGHAVDAVEAVSRRDKVTAVRDAALVDAVETIKELDRWHLRQVAKARTAFYAEVSIGDRDSVASHRRALAEMIQDSAGMVITGGHVGVLLHLLHVFGLTQMIKQPLITWSAGAMACAERVVLFHDHGPAGRRNPEVYAEGLGVYPDVLPFPHPRRRLRLDDSGHLSLLARRFAPRVCLLLGDGVRVDLGDHEPLPPGARWLAEDGRVITAGDRRG